MRGEEPEQSRTESWKIRLPSWKASVARFSDADHLALPHGLEGGLDPARCEREPVRDLRVEELLGEPNAVNSLSKLFRGGAEGWGPGSGPRTPRQPYPELPAGCRKLAGCLPADFSVELGEFY